MIQMRRIIILAILAIVTPAQAQEPRAMTAIDFLETPRLDAPALSPDGTKLVYLQSFTNWSANKTVNRYRLIELATGESIEIVAPEDEKESFGRAYWRPDSSGFITILKRKDDDHEQAYFYSLEDDALTRLTTHKSDIESITWAPDGARFYFVAEAVPDDEEALLLKDGWMIRDYEARSPKQVWTYTFETGETEKVIAGNFFVRGYALSRDGAKIIHMRTAGGLIDDRHRGDLWVTDIATGESVQVTRNAYAEAAARLSPDNTSFAFIATVNAQGEQYYEDNLFVQRIGETTPTLILPKMAMEIIAFSWSRDGSGIYLLGNTGLRTELYHYDLGEEALTRLTEGDHVIGDWVYDDRLDKHVARIADAESPGELFVMHDVETGFERITAAYDDWRMQFSLPRQEAFQWRGRGRQTIEGLLVYPVDYVEGERFPLVTITHGGPRSSSQFGSWNASRFVPVLAGQGYGVLLPNHRGGTGYGDAFMRDMVGGYFQNAHHDTMDGIDALIDRGLADPDRLVKMGWSAGGHMTNKLITTTDRFKAASSGAGASDWISMYAESDVRYGRTPWFGGAPWEQNAPLRSYARQSMLPDAWRVKTPTIFHVGGNDVRVPPTQSIMMHRGLKAAGVDTRLHIARGEPHNYRKPSHRLFKINADLAWFAEYALGESYEMLLPEAAYEEKDDKDETADGE